MDARTLLQPAVVTPKQALSIKPFGLEMDVLLTTEATRVCHLLGDRPGKNLRQPTLRPTP